MVETDIFRGNLKLEEARLCLDFANTLDWHASDHPEESLHSYGDLVNWAADGGAETHRRLGNSDPGNRVAGSDLSHLLGRCGGPGSGRY